jgi:hypothetical protein
MSITKILTDEKSTAEDKLADVANIVAGAREAYGNSSESVTTPRANTTHGSMPFDMLDADSKVEVLRGEVARIKATAIEFTEQREGANLNKKIEELIATNGYFCNIAAGKKFDYI